MRALIFTNDPIKAYILKGEILERYFNPRNIFSNISIVSLSDEDVEPQEAAKLTGSADIRVSPIGAATVNKVIFRQQYLGRISQEIDLFNPDIIIAHNSTLAGYLAAKIGKKHNIPVVIFMHTNPDKDIRAHLNIFNIKKRLFWAYSSWVFENYALRNAALVVCPYKFIKGYIASRGVDESKIKIIYHRIYVDKFRVERHLDAVSSSRPLQILWVSRVYKHKNPENIIRSLKNLNAQLTLIGNGTFFEKMVNLSKEIGVVEKIRFIKSVANYAIGQYYREADVFVSVNDSGGVSKPIMEAMAASLPVVLRKPLWEDKPEFIEDIALVTDGSVNEFHEAFSCLANNSEKRLELGKRGFQKIKAYDGSIIEKEEADSLLSVINIGKSRRCVKKEYLG